MLIARVPALRAAVPGRKAVHHLQPWTRPQRMHAFSSLSSSDNEPGKWRANQWTKFGFFDIVMLATRVFGRWSDFMDFYEHDGFAKRTSEEVNTRMFFVTCLPRNTTVDLFEFMTGATHAARLVYGELYADTTQYPEVCVDTLQEIATDQVVSVLKRKPLRQAQRYAVHAEPRKTKLVLEKLDLVHVGLLSVEYEATKLSDDEAKERGYRDDEWLRMQVAYNVVEHVKVVAASGNVVAIDDAKSFETFFQWTFEANVSDPQQIDWKIVAASDFDEKQAIVKSTARKPLG